LTASLTGVAKALALPCLPFFIERAAARFTFEVEPVIAWIEVAGDAEHLRGWLGDAELPVRVLAGPPALRAVGIAGRELRSAAIRHG
jgi:hypothetical protein